MIQAVGAVRTTRTIMDGTGIQEDQVKLADLQSLKYISLVNK
jgi:hypothetical protein